MAQEFIVPKKQTQKGFVKLDFLSIAMPEHPILIEEPNMGFTGIHYLLDFNRFYAGLGMYGTVSGIRGGFFTLGIDAGFKTKLTNQLFLDTGFHFDNLRKEKLEVGMVITIEPGLYLPKIGGIRYEDMIVITETGYQNLFKEVLP